MIGQIRGKLIGRQAPEILVEVGGIGYEIQVPMTTLTSCRNWAKRSRY